MKKAGIPPIQDYCKSKQYISLITGYLTAFFFGFHLTGIEMIRNHYFEKDAALRSTFYIIAAIPFAVPIISGLLRPFIHLTISQWLLIIHGSNMIAFGLYTTGQVNMLYVARFFTGLGMGLSTNVVPEYVGQLDPARRGFLTYLFQTSIIVGIVVGQVATIFGTEILFMNIFFSLAAVCSLIAAFCTSFIIPVNENQQTTNRKTLFDLVRERRSKKSIFIAIMVHIAHQVSCINAVITYSNGILDKNSDGSSAQRRTICVGLFSLVVTCAATFIIERVGRKVLLQLSFAIVIASLWILIKEYSAFAALLVFQFGFSFGLGPITWLLTNEIFPVEYQAIAAPLCSTINWFLATITVLFFEDWIHKYGVNILYGNIFGLFIIACTLQILLTETKEQEAKFQ